MGIWTKPGQEDQAMLSELRRLAEGVDPFGNRVDRATQIAAIQQYQQIQEMKGRRYIDECRREDEAKLLHARAEATLKDSETKAEVERRRVTIEENRLRLEAVQVQEKLRLESVQLTERLQIEKAEVLVKALQVAVNGGIDPTALLTAIQGLGDRLLTTPAHPALPMAEAPREITGPTGPNPSHPSSPSSPPQIEDRRGGVRRRT